MKKYIISTTFFLLSIFISVNILGNSESSTGTMDVEQVIIITNDGAASGTITANGGNVTLTTVWTVLTNNAFTMTFTGTSKQDTGTTENAFPLFTKQDIDAAGSEIANNYDHLTTYAGLVVSGYHGITGSATWGGGTSPTGTTAHLVATTGSYKPDLGTIMPHDDTNTATITLTTNATSDLSDQSGNYVMTVTATATANEQL